MTDDREKPEPIAPAKMECKCGHGADRHVSQGKHWPASASWCYERDCICSKFVLNHVRA